MPLSACIKNLLNPLRPAPFLILLLQPFFTIAQDNPATRPPVTSQLQDYRSQVKDDSTKEMVELKSIIPGLIYELRYAGSNNFVRRPMYPENTATAFLRLPAAKALQNVQQELNESGLQLKIFDAYRPFSVTIRFWELVKDERYVANPAKGSGHNRGMAIDLTLTRNGQELYMGTDFDNFTDSAHHDYKALPADARKNRELLKTTMEKYGFKALDTEWWHYFLPDAGRFELLDIDFKDLP